MPDALRLRCLVPYCTHTRGPRKGGRRPIAEYTDWICGRHWRMVSPAARAELFRRWRHVRKLERLGRSTDVAWRHYLRQWERCKAAACETAMGI